MGKLVNTGDKALDMTGAYVTIPFSRGIHTIEEGIWERVAEPNTRFKIYCWFAAVYNPDGSGTNCATTLFIICSSSLCLVQLATSSAALERSQKRQANSKRDHGVPSKQANIHVQPHIFPNSQHVPDACPATCFS